MIYFDHNATTPIDEKVLSAMMPFMQLFFGNPSSLYRHGRVARSAVDTAREQIAALVNVQPNQIIFTSGGTEANNLALSAVTPGSKFMISAIEHPSVVEPAETLANNGCALKKMRVNANGLINDETIAEAIEFNPKFMSVMLANNETGIIQNIAQCVESLKAIGSLVHTDAVQALGKMPLDFNQLNVDLMSLSSHKIYGPKGCGALVIKNSVQLKPMIVGGGQERQLRAGTENVPAIVGFGKAAELAASDLNRRVDHLSKLKNLLEVKLKRLPDVCIFAADATRLPNTVQFGISGLDGEMLLMKLDQKGIAVSSGSACASGGGKPSQVLAAMGVTADLAKSAIRVSLGKDNTEVEINEFTQILETLITSN